MINLIGLIIFDSLAANNNLNDKKRKSTKYHKIYSTALYQLHMGPDLVS